jgi:integrase
MMYEFKSIFASEIRDFLKIREASHSKSSCAHDNGLFENLDSYLSQIDFQRKELTESAVVGWISSLTGKSSTIANKVIVIRLFSEYLNCCGTPAFCPVIPKVHDDYIPYLFSDSEITAIFDAADSLEVRVRDEKYRNMNLLMPMVLRIMFGCGTRIGETLAIQIRDVNFEDGTLTLRRTKRNKERIVPMHPGLTKILYCYCLAMGIVGAPERYLFEIVGDNIPLPVQQARHCFEKILKHAQIGFPDRQWHERGPCLHCLRHIFAFKSFAQIERNGWRIDDAVPYLSIYLGHDSLDETQKYLKFSAELFPEALEKFEDYSNDIFPEVSYEE